MMFSIRWLTALVLAATSLGAMAGTDGKYVMDGGAYSIDVQFTADGLQIVEPNKTSTYAATPDGSYVFTNPNNGVTYGIRVIDDNTIEAFKPGSTQPGTILKLSGASSLASRDDNPNAARYEALAEKYARLTETDPDNVHVWAACGAAALGWANMSEDQATDMARQSAMLLKTVLTDVGSTPCPDAIPASVW